MNLETITNENEVRLDVNLNVKKEGINVIDFDN